MCPSVQVVGITFFFDDYGDVVLDVDFATSPSFYSLGDSESVSSRWDNHQTQILITAKASDFDIEYFTTYLSSQFLG
jgi:hypothetical protein